MDLTENIKLDTLRSIVSDSRPPATSIDIAMVECGYCSCTQMACTHVQHAHALIKTAAQKQLDDIKERLGDRFLQSITAEENLSLLRQVRGFRRLLCSRRDSIFELQKLIIGCIFDSLSAASAAMERAGPDEYCWFMDRLAAVFYLLQEAVAATVAGKGTDYCEGRSEFISSNHSTTCQWISINLSKLHY